MDIFLKNNSLPSHISSTSKEAGKAAEQAEAAKLTTYSNLINNYTVIPVAMETLGSWGSLGKKFITEIGSRIADATGEKRSTYFLFQAISMAAQRGNVASILGTSPNTKKLDEIYYL